MLSLVLQLKQSIVLWQTQLVKFCVVTFIAERFKDYTSRSNQAALYIAANLVYS